MATPSSMRQTRVQCLTALALVICLAVERAGGDDAAALSELIDRHVQSQLDANGLTRAPQADDAEFLRRVFLDLHGVVPSVERSAKFIDSNDSDRRIQLIDELLASPRFGEHLGDL